jgi:hypothetical protein
MTVYAQSCPTPQEIKNAETSANSITLTPEQKAAKDLIVIAMKRCPKKLLCSEIHGKTPYSGSPRTVLQLYQNDFNPNFKPISHIDSASYEAVCSTFK